MIFLKKQKSEFLAYNEMRIADNEFVINFINVAVKPIIKDFDKKVANVKIERAIKAKLDEMDTDKRSYVTCDLSYDYNYKTHQNVPCYRVRINRRHEKYNYSDCIEVNLSFILDYELNKSPRLNADKAIEECDRAIERLTIAIDGLIDANENFDKYMEQVTELQSLIGKYNEINYLFRHNVQDHSFHVYNG